MPFLRFESFTDLPSAAEIWRAMERSTPVMTPYQRFDWIAAWQENVGRPSGVTPLIVVGYGTDGGPCMLLPFGTSGRAGCRTAHFLGGKHANFNAAVWRGGCRPEDAEVAALTAYLRSLRPRIDLVECINQPAAWQGTSNPLMAWPHRPAPSSAWQGVLPENGIPMTRRLRRKERRAAELGAVRYWQPETRSEAMLVLEAFFRQKAARAKSAGFADVFAGSDVRRFLREAVMPCPGRLPAIELFAMSVEGEIAAVYGGSAAGRRMSFSVNSIADGDVARCSPGLLLFARVTGMLARRGMREADLGVGEADYKAAFCPDEMPLFVTVMALTPRGYAPAAARRGFYALKRFVKRSGRLFGIYRRLRRILNR